MVNAYGRLTGGADKHCFDVAEILRREGHEVQFVTTADDGNEVHDGVFIPRTVGNDTRDELSAADRVNVARRALWNRTAEAAASAVIKTWRPDVMHVHNVYPQLSVAPIVVAARLGVPVVQHLHDYQFISATYTEPEGGWLDRVDTRLAYRVLNTAMYGARRACHVGRVAAWATVSRAAAAHYVPRGIAPHVLPNFVPLTATAPERRALAERDGVLYFGRLVPEKGIEHVLELAAATDATVRVMGSGPMAEEIERAATSIPNLEFFGPQSHGEVQEHLARARVVVMPSLWDEPGPLAALEAMAAGTPAVTYPAGGLSEYVSDAGSGVVVEPTPAAFIASVESYLDNDTLWTKSSESARAAAATTHSADHYLRRILDVYHGAIEGSGSPPSDVSDSEV
jgi:glycosyltransferase involved in cell wall biosynthesis